MKNDEIVDTLARKHSVQPESILTREIFSRDDLKKLCRKLDLDDSGKSIQDIIDRILGSTGSSKHQPEPTIVPKATKPSVIAITKEISTMADPKPTKAKKSDKVTQEEPLEKKLWASADKLRKNIDAAEYKHVVLGLVFLKYISDAFEDLFNKLSSGKGDFDGADPEDKNEYLAEKVFFVPKNARWTHIQAQAKQPTIGKTIDDAMEAIEKENPALKGVLPKVFAKDNLDKASLGELVDLFSTAVLGSSEAQAKDILGKVYEYFLGEFALAEGKQGGQFYTPASVVRILVEMLEPYEGRVFDPCCGSGGMFVQSEKFIKSHQDWYRKKGKTLKGDPISIYGQESNQTTWRLAKMNLAIRGIDSTNIRWNAEGSFLNDAHKDLKADFVIANPPFNMKDWGGELLRDDARWNILGQKLVPPTGNSNFAWIQHFLYHLSPTGTAGVVLAKGSLTSKQSGEGDIRRAMIEAGVIDCIVNLPTKLFLNTQIPACLWFLGRGRDKDGHRSRMNEILFIDARNLGYLVNRRNRDLSPEDISKIADTYHAWRSNGKGYEDVAGFCKSATIDEVKSKDYVLTPGRYIGLPDEEDDFNFAERFTALKAELEQQMAKGAELNKAILKNLARVKISE